MGDRSVSARDISQSIIVTGDGNNVKLTLGDTGIRLPLRRKQFPPPDRRRQPRAGEPPRELDLLVAETGKLAFIPRPDIFAELQQWLDDETDISVFALTGRAGIGKTRLAIEFCRSIDSNPNGKGEWIAGFVSPIELGPVVEALATRAFAWDRCTFLVIDYAAQSHQALARWLDRLADQKHDAKLRILLLEREAPQDFGWWSELALSAPPPRRDLFYALRPRQLPDLSDLDERRALMTVALRAARELRPEASTSTPIPAKGADADFDRRLAQPQFGNPLNLVMAGVIALDRGPQAALALRRLDAARQIARRELDHRLKPLARSRQIAEDTMRHIFAFNGLVGGLPIAGLRNIVYNELAASLRPTDQLSEVVELLEQEFSVRPGPIQEPRLATIQPDLIGEAVIVEAFAGTPSRDAEAVEAVRRAYRLSGPTAAQALIHLVQDFAYPIEDPDAADKEKATGSRVMSWLLNFAGAIEDPEQLVALASALPKQTTILREPAAALMERLATHFVRRAEQSNDPLVYIYAAVSLNNLAGRLSVLGQREKTLTAIEPAVRLYRAIAKTRPEFLPELARSLNNLSSGLSDLGRKEEALRAAKEAVGLRHALAETGSHPFILELASSLNNVSNILSDLGRPDEALTAIEKAVRLLRSFDEAPPNAFLPTLAGLLSNLALRLSEVGRGEEALIAAEKAVRLFRPLAAESPDAFNPSLALSLNNLATVLSDLYRLDVALSAAKEATGLYSGLADRRPAAFDVNLARALGILGNLYCETGNADLGIATLAKAVRVLTPTFRKVPGALVGLMGRILQNYLARCRAVGREPDMELLGPVLALFETLKQQEEQKR